MRKTQILTNLKATNCCEVTPIEKLVYFTSDPCKLRKIQTSLKIGSLQLWATRKNIRLIAISPLATLLIVMLYFNILTKFN